MACFCASGWSLPFVVERDLPVDEVRRRRLLAQEAEVQHALLQGVEGLLVIAADEVEVDLQVGAAQRRQGLHDEPHGLCLAAAEIDVTRDEVLEMSELVERLCLDGRHLLGARLEEEASFRQLHAALLAREERRAKLLLEVLQLPRERRLRQVKLLCRPCDIAMARDGQKILEDAQFHNDFSPLKQIKYPRSHL